MTTARNKNVLRLIQKYHNFVNMMVCNDYSLSDAEQRLADSCLKETRQLDKYVVSVAKCKPLKLKLLKAKLKNQKLKKRLRKQKTKIEVLTQHSKNLQARINILNNAVADTGNIKTDELGKINK